MTTTASAPARTPAEATRRGRWIEHWQPEDPRFWADKGSRIARRNLIFSIFCEHIGFSVWVLWSVFVLFIPNGQYGISNLADEAAAQKFLLVSLPAGIGSFVRIPYNLAVARFGGRNWTVISAAALLIPCVAGSIWLVPSSSFATVTVLAALTGIGGGNFASSMTNINSFYPQRLKGWALGLNAGGGNLGVAVAQLIGLAVLATAGATHPRVMFAIYIPLIVVASVGAYLTMDNLAHVKNEKHAMRDALKDPHTYVMSVLYIGTFGSFIGFGFAFGQVLSVQFASHFWTVNHLSDLAATRTPINTALARTTWFKNPIGTSYWDLLHHKAIAINSIAGWKEKMINNSAAGQPVAQFTDPATGEHIRVLTARLGSAGTGYDPDPTALAAPVKIGPKVDAVKVAYLTFLGPLIGSLIRPLGGFIADKVGGAKTTFVNFVLMAVTGGFVLTAGLEKSLPLFLISFVALFIFSGIGNGSTYKMIPSIFQSKAQAAVAGGVDPTTAAKSAQRLSGALIGIAGAVGAFGGVLVNAAFRRSFLNTGNGNAAYIVFVGFYIVCAVITWLCYLRPAASRTHPGV